MVNVDVPNLQRSDKETDRNTDRRTERQKKNTNGQPDKHTDGQTDRQTDQPIDKPINTQADRQMKEMWTGDAYGAFGKPSGGIRVNCLGIRSIKTKIKTRINYKSRNEAGLLTYKSDLTRG